MPTPQLTINDLEPTDCNNCIVKSVNLTVPVDALLAVNDRTAHEIFGSPDDVKLKSSMTLFAHVSPEGSAFERVLDKCFEGRRDGKTLELVGGGSA